MIINKSNGRKYLECLAMYLRTKSGQGFAFHIISQLITEFKIDSKGRIVDVVIDDSNPLVIDFE